MKPCREILLVEDSANDVELTTEALKSVGLLNEIFVLRDGEEALDYLHRRGSYSGLNKLLPAVILLDLKLPKVSGLEVLRNLKSDPGLRVLPVVVLTSSREECDLADSYAMGVNAFVVKPIDFHQFMEAIKQLGCFWAILNESPRA